MIANKMTLKEILEYMKELSDTGMEKSDAFNRAHEEYIAAITGSTNHEITEAISFLEENNVGNLNVSNMIEILEFEQKESLIGD